MLLLGDMPGVDAVVVDEVLAAWRRAPSWAAVTAYDDGVGHPFVFSAEGFAALRSLHGDKAVWKLVDGEPVDRVARIRIGRSVPRDVDTWDDYVVACEAFGFEPQAREEEREPQV
jgi:molybdenum cofactor cytidylyltransferase